MVAKSGKPRVSILLFVVLAVAVSLHAIPEFSPAAKEAFSKLLDQFKKVDAEGMTKALERAKDVGDAGSEVFFKVYDDDDDKNKRSAAGAQGSGSTQLIENKHFPRLLYVGVTEIKVGDEQTLGEEGASMLEITKDGSGGVLVSKSFPLTFLNSQAYDLLREKISGGRTVVQSKLGVKDQLCYTSGPAQTITLVFDGGNEMKVEADKCWYPQGDGSMCLAILPSPLSTGETFIGTRLQTGMNVDGDKWTFQTSTKDGSGTSSKSNTAAASKPLLGVCALLLLAYIAC